MERTIPLVAAVVAALGVIAAAQRTDTIADCTPDCQSKTFGDLTVVNATYNATDFFESTFEGPVFNSVRLENASFYSTTWTDTSALTNVVLDGADFGSSVMDIVEITKTGETEADILQLIRTNFNSSTIQNIKFVRMYAQTLNLQDTTIGSLAIEISESGQTNLGNAKVDSAVFSEAKMPGSNFTGAVIAKLEATSVELADSLFDSATLTGEINGFNLTGSSFVNANIKGFGFGGQDEQGGELTNVNFTSASLQKARFLRTNLTGAVFDGADLSEADFTEADLTGASFSMDTVIKDTVFENADTSTTTGLEELGGPIQTGNPIVPGESDNPTPVVEPPEEDPACFPGHATVELDSGRHIPVAQLAVGDRVRVSTTSPEFSEVFFFSHKTDLATIFQFVDIRLDDATTLSVSKSHYLYTFSSGYRQLRAAHTISAGDLLSTVSGFATVDSVAIRRHGGLFNPHTLHGDVVVNGVLTSTYTSTVQPALANLLLLPVRWAHMAGVQVPGFLDRTAPAWIVQNAPRGSASS